MKQFLKIGELATKTGLSVRTLHHYDQIGLLKPSGRTGSGYRLYAKPDIERLQQILSLRQLDFPLDQIRSLLDESRLTPIEVINMHLDRLNKEIEIQNRLRRQLEGVAGAMRARRNVSTDQLLQIIEVIKMSEQYPFTAEQMEKINEQGELYGPEKIKEVEKEWPELIAKVKAEMAVGTKPTDPKALKLARRWQELVNMFTGGDAGISTTLEKRYRESPGYAEQFGMNQQLFDYIGRAIKALK